MRRLALILACLAATLLFVAPPASAAPEKSFPISYTIDTTVLSSVETDGTLVNTVRGVGQIPHLGVATLSGVQVFTVSQFVEVDGTFIPIAGNIDFVGTLTLTPNTAQRVTLPTAANGVGRQSPRAVLEERYESGTWFLDPSTMTITIQVSGTATGGGIHLDIEAVATEPLGAMTGTVHATAMLTYLR
jgi:hypothetical protein